MAVKRHKSFGKKTQKKLPPITFDLIDETFEAHPRLQGAVVLEFAAAMAGTAGDDDEDSMGQGAAAAAVILDFFNHALTEESLKRFRKLTHDPERIVDTEDLTEIVSWLMEQYTDRDLEDASEPSENS
jgi:hypothetical protein